MKQNKGKVAIVAHHNEEEDEVMDSAKANWYNGKEHNYTVWQDNYNYRLKNGL